MSTSTETTVGNSPVAGTRVGDWWLWLGVTCGLAVGVSLLGCQAAPPIKRIVLFYCGLGLATGLGSGAAWQSFQLQSRTWRTLLCVGLASLGCLANVAYLSYRSFEAECQRTAKEPKQILALQILESEAAGQPVADARLREFRLLKNPTFTFFLQHRLKQVGNIGAEVAIVIWLIELLLATLLAVQAFRMLTESTRSE